MAKGSPSMVALLGLLALAGYQNRDKIGAILNSGGAAGTGDPLSGGAVGSGMQQGGLLDNLREMADNLTGGRSDGGLTGSGASDRLGNIGGAFAGGGLMAGLSEIFARLSGPQHQAKAQSWVSTGPNESLAPDELEQALDDETIAELVERTGLSRSELLQRLSATLPDAVDQATPDGQFPPLSVQEPRSI